MKTKTKSEIHADEYMAAFRAQACNAGIKTERQMSEWRMAKSRYLRGNNLWLQMSETTRVAVASLLGFNFTADTVGLQLRGNGFEYECRRIDALEGDWTVGHAVHVYLQHMLKTLGYDFDAEKSFESVAEAVTYLRSYPDSDAKAWKVVQFNASMGEVGFASDLVKEYFQ